MQQSSSTTDPVKGKYFWFLNTLVCIRISAAAGRDGMCLIEHWAPPGDSPPLHIHQNEDEIFYILEGESRFRLEDSELRAGPGDSVIASKGVRHTYRVESHTGGRFLTVTHGSDFERFVYALGRPAERVELPPQSVPTPEAVAQLTSVAAGYGIDLCGPPLQVC